MNRTVYVNGDYLPENEAKISIFDRAFLMSDAVYEVTAVLDGKLIDLSGHLSRLKRSLNELQMEPPADDNSIGMIQRELVRRNGLVEGMVYMQVTRGVADRSFLYPSPDTPQTLVMFTQAYPLIGNPKLKTGLRVITIDDLRWGRRDIKTTQLLGPSMCKTAARERGKDDAWMVQDGYVTEGTSNNAFLIKNNSIITRRLSHDILPGITRAAVLAYAAEAGFAVEERSFTIEEAYAADEAFITSATAFVFPVVEINDYPIGSGKPGPVAERLREIYIEESRQRAE